MKKKNETEKTGLSFGQWMLSGLMASIFVFGIIAFITTKDITQLGNTSLDMLFVLVLYGFYRMFTRND